MKKLILLFSICLITTTNYAQKEVLPQSNAEVFAHRTGAPIQEETQAIGHFGNGFMSTIYYTDLNTNTKISALVLTVSRESIGGKSFTGYIDPDEVLGLSKCIKSLKMNPIKSGVSIKYRTRGGVLFEIWDASNNGDSGLRMNIFKNEGQEGTWDGFPSDQFNTFCRQLELSMSKLIFPISKTITKSKK